MKIVQLAATIALAAFVSSCSGGNDCFQLLQRINVDQAAVPVGGEAHVDVDLSQPGIQVDLDAAVRPDQPGTVVGFLSRTSCATLFDSYAAGTPAKCDVLIGPVTQGTVSARTTLPAGTYRVFVEAVNGNTKPIAASLDVALWGNASCTRLANGAF
jgi:hypothetical protein